MLASFAGPALKLRSFLAVKAEVLSPELSRVYSKRRSFIPLPGQNISSYLFCLFVTT